MMKQQHISRHAFLSLLFFGGLFISRPSSVLSQDTPGAVKQHKDEKAHFDPVIKKIEGWTEVGVRDQAEEIMRAFFSQLGSVKAVAAMFRKSDHVRAARSMDENALVAWSVRVAIKAKENPPKTKFKRGTVDLDFMRDVARLSWSDSGPLLAQEYLGKHGIPLIVEPHLPRTYLDGAAILIETDRPIIGLSLRRGRTLEGGRAGSASVAGQARKVSAKATTRRQDQAANRGQELARTQASVSRIALAVA